MTQTNSTHRGPQRGFTLIELLVVIAIIGILMTILVPAYAAIRAKVRRANVNSQVTSIGQACEAYYKAFNAYPGLNAEDTLPPDGGAQNLVLSLLGGQTLKNSVSGGTRPSPSFYSPSGVELKTGLNGGQVFCDLDKGLPILCYRAIPGQANLVGKDHTTSNAYAHNANSGYTDVKFNWPLGSSTQYDEKALSALSNTNDATYTNFTALLTTQAPSGGSMVIIAAGGDGFYFNNSTFNATAGLATYRSSDGAIYVGAQPAR